MPSLHASFKEHKLFFKHAWWNLYPFQKKILIFFKYFNIDKSSNKKTSENIEVLHDIINTLDLK